ncbi:MAG: FimV/HubP family polar landmark protein [Burkholderiaceae bacterium]
MHPKKPSTLMSFSLRTLGAAVASALLFSTAHAAGLGKLTVLSSLGQPLRAEIELFSTNQEEASSLVAKLAPTDAYQQAKIDFNPVLLSLRFAIVQRGGRQVISLTSTQPINEPFVDVLLELGGNKGRLIREYTFLLDPVDLRLSRNTQAVAPMAMPVAPATAAAVAGPLRQERVAPVNNSVARSGSRAIEAKKSSTYKVKSGDTLTQIALKFKPESISLDQMLVALYRANPDGFSSNNMNRMRTGTVLSVPDSNITSNIAPSVASAVVVAQAADFNAYRNQLAGKIARDAAKSSAANAQNAQSAVGKIETKVEETQANVSESKDKLQISKADAGAGSAAGMANGVAPAGENTVATEKALEEATARIQILEKNLSDLQQLMEIKNKALTEQQFNVQTAESVPTVKAVPLAKPVKPVTPAAAPLAKTGFFDQLLDNPLFLPGAGLLFALLGALGIYSTRLRKKPVSKFGDSAFAASGLQTNSLFGSTGGQSVDTNNSVFNSSFAPSASQLDTNEVDPVAEADVYIAYGRDAQAEEILKEALRTQPDRHPVRLKLLEIYANRKDLRSFEMLASELYGMTKGETDEWHQAARLGAVLDPNNPLYAGGALPEEDVLKAAVLSATTLPPKELDPEALLNNSTSHVGVDSDAAEFAFETIEAAPVIEPKPDSAESTDLAHDYLAEAENSISNGLDFDLGDMDDFASASDVAATEDAVKGAKKKESDDSSLDFITASLDEPAVPEKAIEAEPVSTFPKFDLDEIDFDLPGSTATDKADAGKVPQQSLADLSQDALPVMDIAPEAELDAKAEVKPELEDKVDTASETKAFAEPSTPSLEFDLSGFDLDFDPVEPPAASIPDALGDSGAQSDVALGDVEMSTKIDLAVAYQEIGDKEGARELLEEVLLDGSPAQIEKAKAMLTELA